MTIDFSSAGLDFVVKDGIAHMTFNRPHRRNAITPELRKAVVAAVAEIREDPEIRCALVSGMGEAFSSGADLARTDWFDTPEERWRGNYAHVAREDGRRYGWWRTTRDVWECEKPFVAAVRGPAYGFGCTFALACDIVIAAESARFCSVFVNRGLPVEAAGAFLLARALSPVRAKEMAMLGEPVTGQQAADWGLANRCVPDDQLLEVAGEFARKLATGPSIGIGHVKGQINDAYDSTLEQVAKHEVTLTGLGIGDDGMEALTAFKEKRPAQFKGR